MIGHRIAHYDIMEELGGGGMGVVYRARDRKLARDVALKVLSNDRAVTEGDKRRFIKEARAAAALRHSNICTVYDVGDADGVSYIAMAYIPGRSLRDLVQEGPLGPDRAIDIGIQISHALRSAHEQGIVHRDIKSANIVVDETGHVTILDFGIAKLVGQVTDTGQRQTLGTVAYMSPEQASGVDVDHRTDIWSLGVCLYEMLAGVLPFRGDHDSAVIYQICNQDAPPLPETDNDLPRLQRIVDKALSRHPDARYQFAEQVLADLQLAREELETGRPERSPSIAVLPFANMSDDEKQDYFCEGIAEEIINSLTQVKGLRVASRTSSFAFHEQKVDIRDIGRKLNVDTVLEGSVKKAGDRLRITTQLIDVGDGYHLWSERYDRDLEDIFAIQDEIACNVVEKLKVQLTESEKRVIEKVPTTDVEAYELYMRALKRYHGMDRRGLEYARNLFTNAIIHDPNYALAYCGLSDSYSMITTFYDKDPSNVESALTASEKALELDPELPQAHASYGLAMSLAGRFDEAEREFERAIELAPKLFEAYYFYARSFRAQGKMREAAEMFEKASAVRPDDYEAAILAADTFRGLDDPEAVERWSRIGLAAAERHLEHHPREARAWYLGAHVLLVLGDRDKALEWCDQAMTLSPRDPATLYNAACLFSLLGEVDRCFECFDRAIDQGFSNRSWLENDPDLAGIRSDDRYARLLERL